MFLFLIVDQMITIAIRKDTLLCLSLTCISVDKHTAGVKGVSILSGAIINSRRSVSLLSVTYSVLQLL